MPYISGRREYKIWRKKYIDTKFQDKKVKEAKKLKTK